MNVYVAPVTRLCLVMALCCVLLPAVANASHYRIADVSDVIPAEYHTKLAKAGVHDTRALYAAIAGKTDRRAFAKKSKVLYATLTKWATFIDLMRVDGLGPKMVRLLNAAGVKHLKAFRGEIPERLHPRLRAANRGGKYSEVLPGLEVIRGWVRRAAALPLRLE